MFVVAPRLCWFFMLVLYWCKVLWVLSSLAIISLRGRESWLLCLHIVHLLSCLCLCSSVSSFYAMGCSEIIDQWLWHFLLIFTDLFCFFIVFAIMAISLLIQGQNVWSISDYWLPEQDIILAMTWDFQQCGVCDQQRLRSACAYAQSDQSLYQSLEYSLSVISYWLNIIWSF